MKQKKLSSKLVLPCVVVFLFFAIFFVLMTTPWLDPKPQNNAGPSENSLYRDQSQPIEARVLDLLSYMTLEEKIGQMALVERNILDDSSDIAKYHLGALLSGAGSNPEKNTMEGWLEMIDGFQNEARSTRLGIPLLYGVDAIHGNANVLGATVFPHSIGLGATNNTKLVKEVAKATALEISASGANWNFSPNLDMPQDIRWGRVYEGFSDDPDLVSRLGVAYLQGLQTVAGEESQVLVLATPKHYLGLGGMQWNTSLNENYKIDQGVTVADEEQLRSHYLPPFESVVSAGALSMMVGLNTWGDKRMVSHKYLLTDLLKGELEFKGFLVSDWYGVHEGKLSIFLGTVSAINNGVDMVMLPFEYQKFVRHMKWANRLGLVSDERINDAVGRILYAKFALGLFDTDKNNEIVLKQQHSALARQAVSESLVLLKNNDVLPISPNVTHIRVAGSAANNIGRQMGAWSIEWQGFEGNNVVGATSILEGIKNAVSSNTKVEYNRFGNFSKSSTKADIGVVVVGEKPYAEGWGDRENPILEEEDLMAIKNTQAVSKKVLVIIVSGRPLLIKNEIDSIDALVAAWLPGSEGGGVADVIFGQKNFTGKLPLPWPMTSEQLPIGVDGTTANNTSVMFPRYFGLRY